MEWSQDVHGCAYAPEVRMPRKKKPKTKALKAYIQEIRAVNARFGKLKKHDGKLGDGLAERKDALIDEMQATHRHRLAYETPGSPSNGPFSLGGGPQRFCAGCGLVDQPSAPDGYKLLGEARVVHVTHDEYLARQGKQLRRIGINLV